MKTFNELKQGDYVFVASTIPATIRVYERKVQTVKNSSTPKDGLVLKLVGESNVIMPKESRELPGYSGRCLLVATSKEEMKKLADAYVQKEVSAADERVAYAKEQYDCAVERRNALNNLIQSVKNL